MQFIILQSKDINTSNTNIKNKKYLGDIYHAIYNKRAYRRIE